MPEDVKGFTWSYAGCHLAAHFPVVLHKPPLLFSSIKIKLSQLSHKVAEIIYFYNLARE